LSIISKRLARLSLNIGTITVAGLPLISRFDYFDDFKAYLDTRVKPGDAIDVWPFPTDIATAIARAKYPDAEGRVPLGGAY
jgi:hypothetical protein